MSTKEISPMQSVIGGMVLNALYWAAIVYGTVYNESYAMNLFKFFTWLLVVCWTVNCAAKVCAEQSKIDYPVQKRYIPGIVTFMSDFGIACLAAAFGHWVYASLVMFQQAMEQLYHTKPSTRKDT